MRLRFCGRRAHSRCDTRTSLAEFKNASVVSGRRPLRVVAPPYESSAAEAFGNFPSSPAYLSPAFLNAGLEGKLPKASAADDS